MFANVDEAVARWVTTTGVTEPDPMSQAQYTASYTIYRELYGQLQPSMVQLSA